MALFAACGATSSNPDAPAVADAPSVACEANTPGVRVHLTLAPYWDTAYDWLPGEEVLKLATLGGWGSYSPSPALLDVTGHALIAVPYPIPTRAGPATVYFYHPGGPPPNQWEGHVAFTADPTRCVDVDLYVPNLGNSVNDAGAIDGG